MATASVSNTLECSICCESFKLPKVLTCGHTFCLCCLERYIGDKTETFPCPICQQDVKIPDGGAKMFTTNFIVQTSQHTTQITSTTLPQVTGATSHTTHHTDKTFSKVKYHCPCHRERQIDYYCLTCHCVLCHKCFLKEHKDHEYLDVECETAKVIATELVLTSEKFIQNKIKDLEETHATVVKARVTLQRFTNDACSRITKQTDKIIANIKASSERIMTDIKNNSEESESELTKTGEKMMGDINKFKLHLETNFPSLTNDCSLQILVSLEKIKELEELCKYVEVITPSVVLYLDWNEKDFSLNIDMLGSMVLKQYHIPKLHDSMVLKQDHTPQLHDSMVLKQDHTPKQHESLVLKQDHIPKLQDSMVLKQDHTPKLHYSMVLKQEHIPKLHDSMVFKQYHIPKLHKSNSYQFLFNINDFNRYEKVYYSQDKFNYSNLVWSCVARHADVHLNIKIVLSEDNPKLDYCFIDYQLSLLNIDDSKTITDTVSNKRFDKGGYRWWNKSITWSELTDKNNGYLNSNSQFVIQFDITQIRKISLK